MFGNPLCALRLFLSLSPSLSSALVPPSPTGERERERVVSGRSLPKRWESPPVSSRGKMPPRWATKASDGAPTGPDSRRTTVFERTSSRVPRQIRGEEDTQFAGRSSFSVDFLRRKNFYCLETVPIICSEFYLPFFEFLSRDGRCRSFQVIRGDKSFDKIVSPGIFKRSDTVEE